MSAAAHLVVVCDAPRCETSARVGPRRHDSVRPACRHHACLGNGGHAGARHQGRRQGTMYGPQLMPDGRSVLFTVTTGQGPNRWNWRRSWCSRSASGQRTVVVKGGSDARYLPSGHVVYAVARRAVRHRASTPGAWRSREARDHSCRVCNGRWASPPPARITRCRIEGRWSTSSGTPSLRSLVWTDRNGTASEPDYDDSARSLRRSTAVARWQSRVLVTRDGDIWIYEIASGRSNRVTRDGASQMGVWDPTGSQVAYSSASSGNLEAWVVAADGSGQPRQLTTLGGQVHVDSWSPDGRLLSLHHHAPEGPSSMFMVPMDVPDQKPLRFSTGAPSARARTSRPI